MDKRPSSPALCSSRRLCARGVVLAMATVAASLFDVGAASAQPAPAAPAAPPAPNDPEHPAGAPDTEHAVPRVDDPMLASVPPPSRSISTVSEALRLARSRSADLGTSLDEVERAAGQSRVALAGVLPSLTGQASATHQFLVSDATATTTGGAHNSLAASLTLSVPLVNVEGWYAVGTARANERVARLAVDEQRRLVVQGVVTALIAEVAAERVAETNRVGLADALARLAIVEKKEQLGAGNALDVLRARQDLLTSRSNIVRGDEALAEAREALGLALGIAEPIGVAPSVDVAAIEEGVSRACAIGDLSERADIAAARAKLEVAERGVTDVDLRWLPTLSASSTAQVSAFDQGTSPRGTWNVQANLTWNIWDGGARYGLRREAKAGVSEAQRSLDALGRGATVDVAQSARGVGVAKRSSELSAATRDAALELDRLTRISYERGSGTGLDLVTAGTALRQAQINVTVDQFNEAKANIDAALAKSTCKL